MPDLGAIYRPWMEERLCGDGTGFVPELGDTDLNNSLVKMAKRICPNCPVEIQCGELALEIGPYNFGVWSGERFTTNSVTNKKNLERIKKKVEAAKNVA